MKKLTDKQQNLLFEILGNFDFIKVEKVMHFLDWKWAPTDSVWVYELVQKAKELLIAAIYDESCVHNKGGFSACYIHDSDGEELSLKFIIENMTVDDQFLKGKTT